jgi:membrane-anchored protein YejM (alkaline phosphatase superfamily)
MISTLITLILILIISLGYNRSSMLKYALIVQLISFLLLVCLLAVVLLLIITLEQSTGTGDIVYIAVGVIFSVFLYLVFSRILLNKLSKRKRQER